MKENKTPRPPDSESGRSLGSKKPYEQPRLVVQGDIATITQALGDGTKDVLTGSLVPK